MVGERSGVRYRLSDRVQVQLIRVDMEASKIDFRLALPAAGARVSAGPGSGTGSKATPKTAGVAEKAPLKALPPNTVTGKKPPQPDSPKSVAKRAVGKTKAKHQASPKTKPEAQSKTRTKSKTKVKTKSV